MSRQFKGRFAILDSGRLTYGSAKEVDVFLQLLADAGAIDRYGAETARALFDEVRAMTWRLIHRKG